MKTLIAFILAFYGTAFAQSTRYPSSGGGGGGVSSVSGTAPVSVVNGSTNAVVSMLKADTTHNGYLGSSDWVTFNAKQSTLSAANATTNGYLSSTDWTVFNGKQATISVTAPLTFSANTVALPASDATHNGYLSSTDWGTFNGKQPLLTKTSSLVPFQSIRIWTNDGDHGIRMDMGGGVGNGSAYGILWPKDPPGAGTVLTSDASGNLSWGSAGAGPEWKSAVTCVATNQTAIDWNGGAGAIVDCDNGYTPITGDQFLIAGFPGSEAAEGFYFIDGNSNAVRVAGAATAADYQNGIAVPFGGFNGGVPGLWTQVNYIPILNTSPQHWQRIVTVDSPTSTQGSCTTSSSTPSTTPANLTCTGVPASTAVAVQCSGSAAFSTPTAGGLYCRATGTVNQIACNTAVANTTAMTLACSWVQP